jgi:hypothetical protein
MSHHLYDRLFGPVGLYPLVNGLSLEGFFIWGDQRDCYRHPRVLTEKGKFLVFRNKNTAVDYFCKGVGNASCFVSFKNRDRIKRNKRYFCDTSTCVAMDINSLRYIAHEGIIDPLDGKFMYALNICDDVLRTLKSITMYKLLSTPGVELRELLLSLLVGELPEGYSEPFFRKRASIQVSFMLRFLMSHTVYI